MLCFTLKTNYSKYCIDLSIYHKNGWERWWHPFKQKKSYFIFTTVVIIEYIFQQATIHQNPAISLKIKLKINYFKKMGISDSIRNPQETFQYPPVKVIKFSPGFFVLTTSPECQNSSLSIPHWFPCWCEGQTLK